MPGQRGVIDLDIQFEILIEIMRTKKTDNRFGIHIILMFGRLHGFRLDEEIPLEAFRTGIIARQGQHHGQMFLFTFHVGIQQTHVTFTSAPEHIVLSSKFNGGIQRIFDLRGGISHTLKIGIGGRSVHITFVAENVGRSPQQLDTRLSHLLLGVGYHLF